MMPDFGVLSVLVFFFGVGLLCGCSLGRRSTVAHAPRDLELAYARGVGEGHARAIHTYEQAAQTLARMAQQGANMRHLAARVAAEHDDH